VIKAIILIIVLGFSFFNCRICYKIMLNLMALTTNNFINYFLAGLRTFCVMHCVLFSMFKQLEALGYSICFVVLDHFYTR